MRQTGKKTWCLTNEPAGLPPVRYALMIWIDPLGNRSNQDGLEAALTCHPSTSTTGGGFDHAVLDGDSVDSTAFDDLSIVHDHVFAAIERGEHSIDHRVRLDALNEVEDLRKAQTHSSWDTGDLLVACIRIECRLEGSFGSLANRQINGFGSRRNGDLDIVPDDLAKLIVCVVGQRNRNVVEIRPLVLARHELDGDRSPCIGRFVGKILRECLDFGPIGKRECSNGVERRICLL